MFDLDTLDTVIAVVVVLLVLSLMVQAIQSFIKKMFKLKSKQIEKSLLELFENVIDRPVGVDSSAPPVASSASASPTGASPPAAAQPTSQQIVNQVLAEFNRCGRRTWLNKTVLDSISKEDLLKVLARVDSKHFFADYVQKFQAMYEEIQKLELKIENLVNGQLLQGAASARFAEMRETVAPLINDIKTILSGSAVKKDAVLGDLLRLRRINLKDALKLLAEAQDSVAADLKAERDAGNETAVKLLQQLSAGLAEVAAILGHLSQLMDTAFATLHAKLDHVETWYETVMQSFEERYARHMKSISICISIVIVVYLNASFFRVYYGIAANDLQRTLIVEQGQRLLGKLSTGDANTNANTAAANTNRTTTTSAAPAPDTDGTPTTSPTPTPTPTPTATPTPTPVNFEEEADKMKQAVNEYVKTYEDFGFSPLTLQQARIWLRSLFGSTPLRNEEGELVYEDGKEIPDDCQPTPGRDCEPVFRRMHSAGEWFASRRQDFSTLVGWTIMVLLLSVGAPFWQDTLESLFGVKNLLRKKSDTQNVEKESGAGQPRQ